MTTLRWPDGRGKFVDDGRPAVADPDDDQTRERLTVYPGDTIELDEPDRVDQYLSRGFQRVEDDTEEDGGDGSSDQTGDDGDDFDVESFLDRTPVSDVVDDIEDGEADGSLDAIADAADRVSVQTAVEDRQDATGGD